MLTTFSPICAEGKDQSESLAASFSLVVHIGSFPRNPSETPTLPQ
jgi:hypothetical protein